MRQTFFHGLKIAIVVLVVLAHYAAAQPADPLASWNDGAAKRAVTSFVARAVAEGGPGYIAPADRIAVFDNDGTLWAEQPLYFQFLFALDRMRALAPQHPGWAAQEPFASVLKNDMRGLAASGDKGLMEILLATHGGMDIQAFLQQARGWLAAARHPGCSCPYTSLAYQPMRELLAYLRAHGFKTYIVSGGTVEFMRAFAEQVYGVPPEQVIGTTLDVRFDAATTTLRLQPQLQFLDDGPGKPAAIERVIGRRPVLAFGNSDGDRQMLEWTMAGQGPRLAALVHHTDAAREFAYDRQSAIGRLDAALDEAAAKGWLVVDMRADWQAVFPPGVRLAH